VTINPRAFSLLLLEPNGNKAAKLLKEHLRELQDCVAIDAYFRSTSVTIIVSISLPLKEECAVNQTSETLLQCILP
jgi:hypothetical protein